jgi:DNA polymerase-3 subunit delta
MIAAIVGSDTLAVAEAVDALRSKTLVMAPDFNRDEFDADDKDAVQKVLAAARTLPMMNAQRFVLLRRIEVLDAEDSEPLVLALEDLGSTTVLCLTGSKLDGRGRLARTLKKRGAWQQLDVPPAAHLARWIQDRAARLAIEIDATAAGALADRLAETPALIATTLSQLALYARGPITVAHVDENLAQVPIQDIFALVDKLGAADRSAAVLILRGMLDQGEPALRVLAMVARQFRLLLATQEALRRGENVASALAVPPFVARNLCEQVRSHSESGLAAALQACARADVALKSSPLSDAVVMERLLMEVECA